MSTFKISITLILVLVWLYLLHVTKKANVNFWHFIIGSIGLFLLAMLYIRPLVLPYINMVLTSLIGVFGNITGWFKTIYSESTIFITTSTAGVYLNIDVECSGVIEILAYLSILIFFDAFSTQEKIIYGLVGIIYILFANAIRVDLISSLVYFFGFGIYDFAHTILGRIIFYLLSVVLYYYIFTRSQISRTKTKEFTYDSKENTHE